MTNIDETALARLEALAEDYASCISLPLAGGTYRELAAHFCPALVAEVRRLRRNYECSEKSLQRHEHMVAELMEKVEAWEWFGECRSLILWRGPEDEMMVIFNAAREAVHADRE